MPKYQVRGGNSAFFKDGNFHAGDANGCPRSVLLRHHGVEMPVGDIRTQKTFNIGFMNEELFVKHYMKEIPHLTDYEICEPITENTDFVGHSDVVTDKVVFELKSVSSRSTWDLVTKKNTPKLGNLAQTVNYMVSRETQQGYLVYSLYAYVAGLALPDKFFDVTIDNDGNVLVDSNQTGYTVEHIIADRQMKARVLENNEVFPVKPVNPTSSQSPCHYCPFQGLCDKWDKATKGKETEKFIAKAKEIVNAAKDEENKDSLRRFREAKEKFGGSVLS